MKKLLLVLALVLVTLPSTVSAEEAKFSIHMGPAPEVRQSRTIMYVAQIADAFISANFFARKHFVNQSSGDVYTTAHETNPMMKPFSHGGVGMMVVGFAVGDILRGQLFRRSSSRTRAAVDYAQGASNVAGILETNASWRKR